MKLVHGTKLSKSMIYFILLGLVSTIIVFALTGLGFFDDGRWSMPMMFFALLLMVISGLLIFLFGVKSIYEKRTLTRYSIMVRGKEAVFWGVFYCFGGILMILLFTNLTCSATSGGFVCEVSK